MRSVNGASSVGAVLVIRHKLQGKSPNFTSIDLKV